MVCGRSFENPMHLGEYARIIAFGDEILRRKISHHISLAPLDSFSSRRSLGPYHAFGLLDKSMAYLPSPPLRGTSPKGRGKGPVQTSNNSINRNLTEKGRHFCRPWGICDIRFPRPRSVTARLEGAASASSAASATGSATGRIVLWLCHSAHMSGQEGVTAGS